MPEEMHVYTAESQSLHLRQAVREMFQGVVQGRYLAQRLFWREIKGQYSQSAFGIFWDLAEPLVWAALFAYMFNHVITSGVTGMAYPVFVVAGILLWQTFVDSVLFPIDVIRKAKGLLTHQRVAPEALLMANLFQVGFLSCFRLLIIVLFAAIYGNFSFIGFLKFALLYPSIILAGFSLGVFLAPFNAIYTDVGRFVRVVIRPAMFMCPVIWVSSKIPLPEALRPFNFVATIMNNLRTLITENTFHSPGLFAATCLVLLGVFLIGWFFFHLSIPILADKT